MPNDACATITEQWSEQEVAACRERFAALRERDFEALWAKLVDDHGELFDALNARTMLDEYAKYMALASAPRSAWVAPSALVDLVWHQHILDTANYAQDCERRLGRMVHHYPYRDYEALGDDPPDLQAVYSATVAAYQEIFGEPEPTIWPSQVANCAGGGGSLSPPDPSK